MDRATVLALAAVNREFYRASAEEFDARRRGPWQGWQTLLAEAESRLPSGPLTILDAGCGNGRFGLFLAQHFSRPAVYLGVDLSLPLLATARSRLRQQSERRLRDARLVASDLVETLVDGGGLGALAAGLPRVSLAVLLGVFHHIPAAAVRRRLLEGLAERLLPGGMLAVSVWRYGEDPRFRRRLRPWEALGPEVTIRSRDVEPGDHLLAWGSEPGAHRYCHHTGAAELAALESHLGGRGLDLRLTFDADGRDGDLNRYLLWQRR